MKTGDLILWQSRGEARIGEVIHVGSRPSLYLQKTSIPELFCRWVISTRKYTTSPKESKVHQNFVKIDGEQAKALAALLDRNLHQ